MDQQRIGQKDRPTNPIEGRGEGTGAAPADESASVAALEATGHYRVLARVPPLRLAGPPSDPPSTAIALCLDVETTGLDPSRDEIIELGLAMFRYRRSDAAFLGVIGTYASLRQPRVPIPPAVTRLTGIAAADVAGQSIDSAAIDALAAQAEVVLAHNAGFDRAFAEAAWPRFARLPWACSCMGIDWAARGYEGARPGHLITQAGFYHDGHRALDDVMATIHLLTLPQPEGGKTALAELLDGARAPSVRVWADGAPYRHKDALRRRGYRWSDGTGGAPRAWFRDMPAADGAAEADFLRREILAPDHPDPRVIGFTAVDRYSRRAGMPPDRDETFRRHIRDVAHSMTARPA